MERSISLIPKFFVLQGLDQLRFAKTLEINALQNKQDALILAAQATGQIRRSVGISVRALQLVQLAVAQTPSSKLHTVLHDAFEHLKALGVEIPEKVLTAGDAAELLSRHLKDEAQVLAQSSTTVTGEASEVRASFQTGVAGPSRASASEIQAAIDAETLQQPLGVRDSKVQLPALAGGPLHIDPPSIHIAGVDRVFIPREVSRRADVAGRRYVCSWPGCTRFQNDPCSTRATVSGHIRREHTKQQLVCPAGPSCLTMKTKGRVFTTANDQSLHVHWGKCGPQIHAGPVESQV